MINYTTVALSDLMNGNGNNTNLSNHLKKFKCAKEKELESFLEKQAIKYENMKYGKTYLLLNEAKFQNAEIDIMAFFTIGQKALVVKGLSQKKKRKVIGPIPGRDKLTVLPTYLIGQIGRDDRYSHVELPGDVILDECYHQLKMAQAIVGGDIVMLECHNRMYELFYQKQGYNQLSPTISKNPDELITLYKRGI